MADADDTRPRGRSQSFLERAAIEAAAAMKNEYVDSQLVDDWCDEDGTLQAALNADSACDGTICPACTVIRIRNGWRRFMLARVV